MNEIYGIDPEVPAKWNDIHVLTLLFGIHQGRFIASYPSEDWEFFLFKNISDLKDIEQSKAKRKIEQLRDAYYPLEAEYRRTKKWIDNVYEFQSKNKALAQVFTDPANQYQYPSLKDLLDGSTDLPDGSGKRIEMTVHSYRKVLKPLFLKSTELHFIDRFFHLRDEDGNKQEWRRKTLVGLFEEAKLTNRCKSFVFHVDEEKYSDDNKLNLFNADAYEIAKSIGFNDLQIEFTLSSIDKRHDRCIFSIKGGLGFDSGFDTSPDLEKKNKIQWLSPTLLDELLDEYGRGFI